MIAHQLDLRPIASFAPAEKAKLPVSVAREPSGLHVVSRYEDYAWDFYPYIQTPNLTPGKMQIDWRVPLPDGRLLTDPEHARLLESSKDFIWSLYASPIEGRKRPSMQTLVRKATDLMHLVRWMTSISLRRFAELEGRTSGYIDHSRRRKNGEAASGETVAHRLLVVEDLYRQKDNLADALSVHPWPGETTTSLSGRSMDLKPRTDVIPDAIASALGELAIDYVQRRSSNIIAAFLAADEVGREKQDAGLKTTAQSVAKTSVACEFGFGSWGDLVANMVRLRTACYIVIDLFSGIRDSEMKSLQVDCVAPGKTRDGSTDVLWLHGTIYKTGMRPKRWMVPPIVSEAVNVLTLLTAPLRVAIEQEERALAARVAHSNAKGRDKLVKRLDALRKMKSSLFLMRPLKQLQRGITVLPGVTINHDLKKFCADLGIRDSAGKAYRLHAHQFRRTYARFMASSELGDLITLRDHFGHWTIDMTVLYADGGADEYEVDTELLEMVTSEKQSRQSEIMNGYLDSDAPLANGGHWLRDWRASVRTAPNKEALIKEYASTITLNGTGHSWCVGNAKGAGCGGLCVFEAQMCVDCKFGIIGQEHRPVWEGIRDQQLEVLTLEDIGPGGQARARHILAQAERVLKSLDGREAP
ncbi:integrase [Azospira sp. APE16]|uniref:integrase n=1 Tax=Azospira sp. APE16 TaxID=3394231 RepID=UPI003A4D6B21